MVRLAHAAHRLNAWAVLIAAASEALKTIPATECLVLHHELDLQSVLRQHIEEIDRRHRVSNTRARARGLPERDFTPPVWSGGNWNFETVFCNVVKSTSLKLPVVGLDDKLNFQLALARAALFEKRYVDISKCVCQHFLSTNCNTNLRGRLLLDLNVVVLFHFLCRTEHVLRHNSYKTPHRFVVKWCEAEG